MQAALHHQPQHHIIAEEAPFELLPDNLSAEPQSATLPFIEANTKEVSMEHLRNDCIIPVFSKDNEVSISHTAFIESVWNAASNIFKGESLLEPQVRTSHIVKGRIPEAIHKPVSQLLENDKTIYYERMMFCIEIPSIYEMIDGNKLNLTIGGVRAYNAENLYSKKGVEKFKIFIGFKNMVCCNMCISTDGLYDEVRVMTADDLITKAIELFVGYNAQNHLASMAQLCNYSMTESQFAQMVGKSKLYQFLEPAQKKSLPELSITDYQINSIIKNYYSDDNFGVNSSSKEISLWQAFNLFTEANKSSYIDSFLYRGANATNFISGISQAFTGQCGYSWFIE